MIAAQLIVYLLFLYVIAGLVFASYFSFFAVKRFDEAAKESGVAFRAIIFPGVVALWPILLARMLRGLQAPDERNAHRISARRRAR